MKKKVFKSILNNEPAKKLIELAPQFAKLFEPFSVMHPNSIACLLFEETCKIWSAGPWNEYGPFLDQLESYSVDCQLSTERSAIIADFLSKHKSIYTRGIYIVESRPCLHEGHKDDLNKCYKELKAGKSNSELGRPEISILPRTMRTLLSVLHEPDIVSQEYIDARIKEVTHRLRLLATRRSAGLEALQVPVLTISPPAIGTATLAPEQIKEAFHQRLAELQDILDISYSTFDDDGSVVFYNYTYQRKSVNRKRTVWCPMNDGDGMFKSWLKLSHKRREAIRLGFMYGLCKMLGYNLTEQLLEWRRLRPEVTQFIKERLLNPISEEAERTGDYAKGKVLVEKKLSTIYAEGQNVPYHQEFEKSFINAIKLLPLSRLDDFVDAFTERKNLATSEGYAYLSDVVTNTADEIQFERPALLARVNGWLSRASNSTRKENELQYSLGSFIQGVFEDKKEQSNNKSKAQTDYSRILSTPVASQVPNSPSKIKPAITIATLCLHPFTPVDLNALLQHLGVLDAKGRNLTVHLEGRSRSKWGKFTAVYRVLHKCSLMDTVSDAEWANAFKAAYGAYLGGDVTGHILLKGRGAPGTPKDFRDAVDNANHWINGWIEWRGKSKERPLMPFIAP